MYVFKGNFGRYQSLRHAASTLSISPWHQQLSSSSVCADSVENEEPAFGSLSSDPSSEFYERKKNHEKSSSKTSQPFREGQIEFKEERTPSSALKSYEGRRFPKYGYVPKDALPKSLRQAEFEEQNASTPNVSGIHKTFQQKQTMGKWHEFKNVDNEKIQRLSQTLVQDDDEGEYFRYFSTEPDAKMKLFNERFENRKRRDGNRKRMIKSDGSLDAMPTTQTSPDEEPFGQLSPPKDLYEEESGDEGDEIQRKYEEAKLERRHTPAYYGFQMKKLCKERKLVEALKILEVEMPAVNAKPDRFCYQVLINTCGRAGYTKKAFQLYNQMKKRGHNPQPVTYTGLFNACAESPWPTDGLSRAHKLREQLKEKGFLPNETISHAMIKAFGRCGDIKTSFLIVDEMLEQGLLIKVDTINFMLQACISDQETGFRHALLVWRKMRELRLNPNIYTYNLLVRCVSFCKAGDPALTTQLLEDTTRKPSEKTRIESNTKVEEEKEAANKNWVRTEDLESTNVNQVEVLKKKNSLEGVGRKSSSTDDGLAVLPNLLGRRITSGDVVGLSSLEEPQDRLALLGGSVGLIRQMMRDRVTPDLKTVTQMLNSLPIDREIEESLLQSMKNIGIVPDTQFCNMLIRRRCFWQDMDSAKAVLDLMQEHSLLPDVITFGCLSLGCKTLHAATELLSDMDAAGFRPNLEIMSTLVKSSIRRENYFFTLEMLREMHNRNISPDEKLLSHLENARIKARETILKMDSGKLEAMKEERRNLDYMKLFLLEYKNWLKKSEIQPDDHPWAQYRYSKANS